MAAVALHTALIWHDEVMHDLVVDKPRRITLGRPGRSTGSNLFRDIYLTGGFGAGLTQLELGGVDVVPITEPMWSANPGKYRIVASAPEVLPALSNVVGVTTGEAAKTRGDFIRGVLKARRKAVEFMYANPAEASKIIAKVYNLDAGVTEKVVRALLESEKKGGVPYWGPGDLRIDTMNNMIRAQKLVGAVKGDVDWSKLIDESFLPDDLKSKKK